MHIYLNIKCWLLECAIYEKKTRNSGIAELCVVIIKSDGYLPKEELSLPIENLPRPDTKEMYLNFFVILDITKIY